MKQLFAIALVLIITGCSSLTKPMSDEQYNVHMDQVDEWKAQESLRDIEQFNMY